MGRVLQASAVLKCVRVSWCSSRRYVFSIVCVGRGDTVALRVSFYTATILCLYHQWDRVGFFACCIISVFVSVCLWWSVTRRREIAAWIARAVLPISNMIGEIIMTVWKKTNCVYVSATELYIKICFIICGNVGICFLNYFKDFYELF